MVGLENKDAVQWFGVFREFLVKADNFLDDFQKQADHYQDKLKGVDFTNPDDLQGLSSIMTENKMPVFLSFLGELVSFATLMEKFQSPDAKNDSRQMRDNIKNMIRNIDKLLEGV